MPYIVTINRIQEVTGKKKKEDICNEMGTTTQSLRNREKRNEFDANWAFKISQKTAYQQSGY
ncbi:MAG: hypothetical protein QTN59_00110 [Candidatus Electrothrix communis]|nr:MAG: hypothetical protein QTN59_00110 [Candidatus Electrothrix communis]